MGIKESSREEDVCLWTGNLVDLVLAGVQSHRDPDEK